jgi:hypothetical protein
VVFQTDIGWMPRTAPASPGWSVRRIPPAVLTVGS